MDQDEELHKEVTICDNIKINEIEWMNMMISHGSSLRMSWGSKVWGKQSWLEMGEHLRGTMEMRRWTSTSDFFLFEHHVLTHCRLWGSGGKTSPLVVAGCGRFVYHLKGWCVWSTMEKRNCGQLSGTWFSVKHNDPLWSFMILLILISCRIMSISCPSTPPSATHVYIVVNGRLWCSAVSPKPQHIAMGSSSLQKGFNG